jgi:hypothetical protein
LVSRPARPTSVIVSQGKGGLGGLVRVSQIRPEPSRVCRELELEGLFLARQLQEERITPPRTVAGRADMQVDGLPGMQALHHARATNRMRTGGGAG